MMAFAFSRPLPRARRPLGLFAARNAATLPLSLSDPFDFITTARPGM